MKRKRARKNKNKQNEQLEKCCKTNNVMEKHMVKKKQQKRVAEFTKPVGKKQRHQRQTKTTDIRCIINNYLAVPIIVRCMDCLKGQNSLIGLMLKQRFRKHLGKVDKDKGQKLGKDYRKEKIAQDRMICRSCFGQIFVQPT